MNKKTLYLECYSGISGDMTVAALLDLGADREVLQKGLSSLHVEGYKIKIGTRLKNSIEACDFDVILEEVKEEHSHKHEESHSEHHVHSHEHIHYGQHEHRNLYEINQIIECSEISPRAKELAKKIFTIVAEAESRAHGKPVEEVHFHEVGAIDSIVDIVATAICLDDLRIEDVIVSELHEGTGQIRCQHGILPIPVPAVINIVQAHQLPLHITSVKGELVTPTGAAIVAAIRTGDRLPGNFRVVRLGLGAGKRNYEHASGILRAMIIEEEQAVTGANNVSRDKVWVLEANIDDCSGEALALAMERLFEDGARDVYYTPIIMKKNRPAYLLGVICDETDIRKMEEDIFTHTSTIGIRKHETERTTLNRKKGMVSTPYGDAQVKVCTYEDKIFYYPEYESIKEICKTSGLDYMTVYAMTAKLAKDQKI